MNIEAVKDFKKLDVALQVLLIILYSVDECGVVNLSKKDLSSALDICKQTIGRHLSVLAKCNIIKYKYSGAMRLNPDFYHKGGTDALERAKKEYEKFKSDI